MSWRRVGPARPRTSGAWLGSGVGGETNSRRHRHRHEILSRLRLEGPFLQMPAAAGKKRDKWPFLIGRDTEARLFGKVTPTTSERPSHSSSRRIGHRPRAASPSNTVVLVMSLAVVPPHRAPSIDPALRAFLAECLDGVGVDGDVGDVPSREVPDLPRELSFDDADVDLSGICAWLEGDVGLTMNDGGGGDDDDDARELASTTPRASSTSKKRAPPGSLDDDSVRDPPARASIDKRSRRGAPATPPRRDELTDPGGSVEYSDPNSDPSSAETNSPAEAGDPKEARLRRNRASAALSRQRKRLELVHLRQRCRELERAAAHFQFVAQQAFAENVDLRRRLDGVAGEVAGSNPVVAAASVVTRLPIPRTAPMQSTTTRGRRTGAADVYGENRGEAPSGAPSSGRAGQPFGADDAAYTLCDMPRVESRRRRGAASRSRRRGRGGVKRRRTRAARRRGRRRVTHGGGRETRLRATGSVPNAPRRAALPLRRRLHRRVARPVPKRLVYSRIERLNKPAALRRTDVVNRENGASRLDWTFCY